MLQFGNGGEINTAHGDKRTYELAILGEVRDDVSLDELFAYNGLLPLWKRIVVTVRYIRVSHVICCYVLVNVFNTTHWCCVTCALFFPILRKSVCT